MKYCNFPNQSTLVLLIVLSASPCLIADERLAGKACRSVHLGYPGPPGTAFYCEVEVDQSAAGSYFMVCGWNTGYFGIQEIRPGKKVVLFSVWDNSSNSNIDDPDQVKESERVGILHSGKGVQVSRFGGEGTGGKSMFDFDWKIGQTYRCLVTSKVAGERTEYSGYFYLPDEKTWKHLATFSTITGGAPLKGYYSFVEDFRRNGESTKQIRKAKFGQSWIRDTSNGWHLVTKARFTADSNPAQNIDAGVEEDWFYLATGGETQNSGLKLRSMIELLPSAAKKLSTQGAPKDLP